MIEQTPRKGEPGLADNRASSKHLPIFSAQWHLARLPNYFMNNFNREGGNIAVAGRIGDRLGS